MNFDAFDFGHQKIIILHKNKNFARFYENYLWKEKKLREFWIKMNVNSLKFRASFVLLLPNLSDLFLFFGSTSILGIFGYFRPYKCHLLQISIFIFHMAHDIY